MLHPNTCCHVEEMFNIYENDTSFVQDRTALLFLLFPSTLLILRSWVWAGCLPTFPVQMYQVFSLKSRLFDVMLVFTCLHDEIFVGNLSLSIIIVMIRPGCYSFTLVWHCERTYWESTEVIFVLGIVIKPNVCLHHS